MKYIRTAISEQETTINILYEEQIIRVYSSRAQIIKQLTKLLGMPTVKYKKNKTYWSGASWDLKFNDFKKIEKILVVKGFIDNEIEIKAKKLEKKTKKVSSKKSKETKTKKVKDNKTKKKNIKPKEELTKKSKAKIQKKTKKSNTKIKTKKVLQKKSGNQIEFEQFSLL